MRCQCAGPPIGKHPTPFGEEIEFSCQRHDSATASKCLTCPEWSPQMTPDAFRKARAAQTCPHPPGVFIDRYAQPAAVADLFLGAPAFLLLGGPSARSLPLNELSRRGCLTLTVNNAAGMLPERCRPHVMIHTDGTGKFHDSLWRDPAVLKLTPVKMWNGTGRPERHKGIFHRAPNGELRQVPGVRAKWMPSVYGFHRNSDFRPNEWLFEPTINQGNDEQHARGEKGHKPNGFPNVINTMFAALRIAFYLGVKRLYLLGCDFSMDVTRPYGFEQEKNPGGVGGCNASYGKMCCMFDALRPHFDAVGFEVYNCNPDSGCWSFDSRSFADALADATDGFEPILNTKGWYSDISGDQIWDAVPSVFQRQGF